MRNGVKSIFAAILVFLLSGCAQNGQLSRKYHFEKNKNYGVAAFTVRCRGVASEAYLDYSAPILYYLAVNTPRVEFPCDGRDHVRALSLPSGKYQFTSFATATQYAKKFKPIDFRIQNHKVNYIGHIDIFVRENNRFDLYVSNRAIVDIPRIQKHFRKLPKQAYQVKMAS